MEKPSAIRYGALWIAIVALGHFAGDMYPGFVTPLLPYFKDLFKTDYLANSMLPAVAHAGMILQPLFGILSDRIRGKHFIVAGIACSAVFYPLMTLMPGLSLVAVCVFLGALGVSMFHPQSAALTGRLPGAETGRPMSWFVAGGQSGVAAGMLVAPVILDRFSPGALIFTMPFGLVVAATVLLVPVSAGGRPDRERRPEGRLLAQAASAGWPLATLTLFVVLRAFVINGFCYGVPLLRYGGHSLTRAAAPVVLFLLAGSAGVVLGGRLAGAIGEKALLVTSSLVGAAFLCGFLATGGWVSWVMLAAAGMVLSSSVSLHVVLGQRQLPDNASAASSLMIGIGWGVGGLLLPVIGALADLFGSLLPALWGVAIISAATALVALFVPTARREVCGGAA